MGDFWNLLSVNSDLEGMEFISTLEAKDFPFYATQVHELKRKMLIQERSKQQTLFFSLSANLLSRLLRELLVAVCKTSIKTRY